MPKTVQSKRQVFLTPLIILFSFLLPLLFLILGIVIFRASNKFAQTLTKEENIKAEESLSPSQILKDKNKYRQEKIWLRGRVTFSPVVCKKKQCPDDACCGCPDQRDLVAYDTGTILNSSGQEKLNLKDVFTGQSFCQRKQGSCDYDCDDWRNGAIYDVYGKLFADTPPPGWQKSLNYYFEVESKTLVKTISFGESLRTIFDDLKEKFKGFGSSGQFVLP